jgi:hypothetical protein
VKAPLIVKIILRPAGDILVSMLDEYDRGTNAAHTHFGAVWCGPCKLLEAELAKPALKPLT